MANLTTEPTPAMQSGGPLERIKTLGWSGVENVSRQILALLFFFGIVRYIQPTDLGIASLSVALNAIFAVFIDEPIGEALVQKASVSREDWDTGFTINLMIAAGFVVVSCLVSGVLAMLLHEPQLVLTVPVLSVFSLSGALGNIQRAYLSRVLRFRAIAQTVFVAQLFGGVAGVGLAMEGFGYWAQIISIGVTATAMTVIFYAITPWRPRLRIDRRTVASRLPYTIYSVTIRSIYLLRDQAPLVIVGLLSGTAEVGFLSLALRVARSLGQLFEDLTSRPVLSLLSREQHDIAAFGRVLLDILTIIGLIAIPAFIGLAVIGEDLIPLAFGAVWAPAGRMLPWVCAVLAGWLFLHVVIVSLRACDQGRRAVFITTPAVVADVLVLAVLAPISLEWALIGWAARAALSVPVALVMLQRYLGVPATELAKRWIVPIVAASFMFALLRMIASIDLFGSGILGMVLTIGAAAALYGIIVLAGMPTLQKRIRSVLRPAQS